MPASHVEIERSFDMADDADLPDLAAVTGVEGVARVVDGGLRHLVATYYDTADHRLLRAGASLRRRAGGDDAGWHLKLPADGGRLEVHATGDDPAGGRIPDELVALTRSLARRHRLQPVATLTTSRRLTLLTGPGDAVLAEVADDDVAATVGSPAEAAEGRLRWREVEVELVEGDAAIMDAVGDVLLGSGARPARYPSKIARALDLPSLGGEGGRHHGGDGRAEPDGSAGGAAVSYLRAQVERIVRLDPLVRMDADDAVHQMRVALRRLRSVLVTFRPVLDRGATDPLRAELRWLAGVLGPARDLEVLRDRLTARLAGLDADQVRGPVPARLANELSGRRRVAFTEAVQAMDSERYLDLLDRLDAAADAPPLRPAARRTARRVLLPRLRRDVDRVVKAAETARRADGPARDLALHEVRKAAKRARYAAEAVSAARTPLRRQSRQVVGDLKDLQEVLGDRQDSVVARQFLDRLARRVHEERGDAYTYGLLLGSEQAADAAGVAVDEVVARARRAARRLPS